MPQDRGKERNDAIQALVKAGRKARAFVSMPMVEGITPRVLLDPSRAELHKADEGFERRHGTYRLDEIGLSLLDHDVLYGDACFEGILIKHQRVFLWREHLERFWRSAGQLGITIPYDWLELTNQIMKTIREVTFQPSDNAYIRLVVTRGLGDLGINPKKCVGATVFAVVSTISLYPPESYERGIPIGIARTIRRPGATILDPRIKSNNYLNNVLALQEGCAERGVPECLMLTRDGFVAEATVDNIFAVIKGEGWAKDPSRVRVLTPSGVYCLNGITRKLILEFARDLGYQIEESSSMLPLDLTGPDREVFMTGTGAFVMPIISVDGHQVGNGRPGEITRILLGRIQEAMADPNRSLSPQATLAEIKRYLGV